MTPEERALRVDLAAAFRIIAHYGWDDLIFTHMSVRTPGPDHHFLINPYNLMFEEVTASSLVKIDQHGNPVEPTNFIVNPAGFVIHSALHMGREDAQCVIHLHTRDGQAVSAQADGLLPITQTAMIIEPHVAYHDYEGIATNLEERKRLVADLGDKNALVLRNHGTLALGPTVASAFLAIYYLERACSAQIAAQGARLNMPPAGAAETTDREARFAIAAGVPDVAWAAVRRKLDRLDPSYAA